MGLRNAVYNLQTTRGPIVPPSVNFLAVLQWRQRVRTRSPRFVHLSFLRDIYTDAHGSLVPCALFSRAPPLEPWRLVRNPTRHMSHNQHNQYTNVPQQLPILPSVQSSLFPSPLPPRLIDPQSQRRGHNSIAGSPTARNYHGHRSAPSGTQDAQLSSLATL